MRKTLAAVCFVAGFASGCQTAGPIGGSASGGVEQAVSRQTPATDAQRQAKLHVELGTLYFNAGRMEVALEEARIAAAADAGYAPAYNLMGLIYMALRQHDHAEQSFQRALSLARRDPEINNDYGWFLCRSGRARDSLAHFQIAYEHPLYQFPVRALTNAGVCAIVAKDDRLGEELLLRALRADRNNVAANYWLADIAYRSNRLLDARQRIEAIHTHEEPTAASAWLGLRIERKLGNREGEARFMGILRSRYRDSEEHMKMSRGEYD